MGRDSKTLRCLLTPGKAGFEPNRNPSTEPTLCDLIFCNSRLERVMTKIDFAVENCTDFLPYFEKCFALRNDQENFFPALRELIAFIGESIHRIPKKPIKMIKNEPQYDIFHNKNEYVQKTILNVLVSALTLILKENTLDEIMEGRFHNGPYNLERMYGEESRALVYTCNKEMPQKFTESHNISPHRSNSLTDFEEFDVISSNSLGTILKTTHAKTKQKFSLKITHGKYYTNIRTLKKLACRNLVSIMDIWAEEVTEEIIGLHRVFGKYDDIQCIQMELCTGRDLNTWIRKPPRAKTVKDAKRIICQISMGIKCLHENGIIHMNLKPSNILLLHKYEKDQNNLNVKIGDYGMSVDTFEEYIEDRDYYMSPDWNSVYYMSQEQKQFQTVCDKASDIYSMGVIFGEVLLSSIEKIVPSRQHNDILSPTFEIMFAKEMPLISSMLKADPTKRPTASQILKAVTKIS